MDFETHLDLTEKHLPEKTSGAAQGGYVYELVSAHFNPKDESSDYVKNFIAGNVGHVEKIERITAAR